MRITFGCDVTKDGVRTLLASASVLLRCIKAIGVGSAWVLRVAKGAEDLLERQIEDVVGPVEAEPDADVQAEAP